MKLLRLIIAILLLSACASVEKRQPTGLTEARFFQMQRDRQKYFQQISSKLSLRYEGGKDSISGKGRFISGGKNQYRIEVRDPLGRLHYLVALSENDFQAQYPRQGRAYIDGQGGRAYLQKLAGIQLDFKSLAELAIGVIPAAWQKKRFDSWEWDATAGMYRGTAKVGTALVECLVDGQTGVMTSLVVKDPEVVAEVKYSDQEPCCDGFDTQQSLAKLAEAHWPQSKATFEFEWNGVKALTPAPQESVFKPAVDDKWKVVRF